MGSLLAPKPKIVQAEAAPPVPMIDEAANRQREDDRRSRLRRGRGTTILTGDGGLPNLGSTTTPSAGGA